MTATKPTASKFAKVDEHKHRAALIAMAAVSTEGNPSGEWLRLAGLKKNDALRDALRAVGIDLSSKGANRAFGHWCRFIRDKPFSDGYVLRSRFYNGDRSWRHGVAWPGRADVLARREKTATTKAAIEATAAEIARQLHKGADPLTAAKAVLPRPEPVSVPEITVESIQERSRRTALEATRAAGYFAPIGSPTTAPAAAPEPAPEPVILEEVRPAAVVDTTDLPGAWKHTGRPDYSPKQFERPDESFRFNAEVRASPWRASGAEGFDFSDTPRQPRKPWSPF